MAAKSELKSKNSIIYNQSRIEQLDIIGFTNTLFVGLEMLNLLYLLKVYKNYIKYSDKIITFTAVRCWMILHTNVMFR